MFANAVKSVVRESENQGGWSIISGGDTENRINKNNLLDANKNWVFVAVRKNADNVAQAELKLMQFDKNGKDKEIFDNPALQLLWKPNKQMTGKQFLAVTWAHIELTGSAYWLIKRTGTKVTSLFPLPPTKVSPIMSADYTEVIGYKYIAGAKTIGYGADEIFHIKTPDISNPLNGKGTLEGIGEWVDVDNYITEFNRRFFINGATFGSAIETDTTSTATLDTLRKQVQDVYTGVKNAFRIYILPKGSKFVESSMTMKDMDMSEGDNRYRDKILSGFGVPKSVLGITEAGSSRADAEAKNYAYQEFTIKPRLVSLTDYLTEFFIPVIDPKNAPNLYFTFVDPTPDSKEMRLNENKAGLANQAYLTVNEVRASYGLAPVEGGDTVNFSANFSPLGSSTTDPNAGDPMKEAQLIRRKRIVFAKSSEEVKDELATKVAEIAVAKLKETGTGEVPDRRKAYEAEYKEFAARATATESKVKIAFMSNDINQMERVMKNLNKWFNVEKGVKEKTIGKADLLDYDAEVKIVMDFATPLLGDLWKVQAATALAAVSADLTFDFNAVSEKLLARNISRMAKNYTTTTLDILTGQLNEGLKAGDSLQQLTKRVQQVYGLTEQYRAQRVARTETFAVANTASRDAYKQSGVVKSVEWYTAEDELVCEYCAPLDGTTVSIEDSFYDKGDTVEGSDGGTMDITYAGIPNPPLHANCRCEIKAGEISIK